MAHSSLQADPELLTPNYTPFLLQALSLSHTTQLDYVENQAFK